MSDTSIKAELDKLLAAAANNPTTPKLEAVPAAEPAVEPANGLVRVTSAAEFARRIAEAPGQVAVLFTQDECGYCDEDKEALKAMAKDCPTFTALEVSVDNGELERLGRRWKVDGTPTLLFAERGRDMTPRKAEEVDPERLKSRLKCALPKKG